ncbi:MAG: ABC transporter permease [Verrucomicrobiota bacterium]|nr:ABC transporter permease [Verrucomicrobiota bacterium]
MNSLRRISAIAHTTFVELARLRVFGVLVLFAMVLIASSTFLARISFQQELQVSRDIALGAINFFLCLLAIVATAQLLPRDVEDRVVYSVLAKPVSRAEYILGKFFGVLTLLVASLVTMALLCVLVLHWREGNAVREVTQQFVQSPELPRALRDVHASGVNVALFAAFGVLFIKSAILAAATLCLSTFATSNIFTISAMAMVYLVGHLESTARDYWLRQHAAGAVTSIFIGIVAFLFPDLEAFNVSDQLVAGTLSSAMLWHLLALAGFYTLIYLLLAIAIFNQREL